MNEISAENRNFIIMKKITKNIIIDIEGDNNQLSIESEKLTHMLKITIRGNNNHVRIADDIIITKELDIFIGGSDISIEIGKGTTIGQAIIRFAEDGTRLKIGEDCMISDGVEIWGTDMHGIIDNTTKSVVNNAKDIIIEKHCWLGSRCMIMKNTHINEGCIVAAGAIVASDVLIDNVMIGGVPARIIKKEVEWVRESPKTLTKTKCDNFTDVAEDDNIVAYMEDCCNNSMIKGWCFLKNVDSKNTNIYLEIVTIENQCITFLANKERRDDVAAAYGEEKYSDTGFWFMIPDYLKSEDIQSCRIICKNGNIISAKKIEM